MSSALLERSLRAPAPAAVPRTSLGFLTLSVPCVGAARFLAAATEGEPFLWAPPPGDADGWLFAGRGIAAEVRGAGGDRFADVRDGVQGVFAALHGAAGTGEPPLRLFGGFSFEDHCDGVWAPFAEASFVLPRILYAEREGRAWVRVFARLDALEAAVPALYRVRAALARGPAVPRGPAIATVEEATRAAWDDRVAAALSDLRAGRLRKVVLARRTHLTLASEPTAASIVSALPGRNATRFAFGRGSAVFAGATPERLVSLEGGRFRCDALGGSIPRTGDDDREIATLLASAKDGREHAAVVSGIRDSLAALAGSVETAGPRIRTLGTVHHLHTEITGLAPAGVDVLALVEALHPTPAVCGEPRPAARSWIAANEGASRGWYAGPVGWLDPAGDGSFCVALRCALLAGAHAFLWAGAGLVEGSDAGAEWRETAAKQAPMLQVLGAGSAS